MTCNHSVGCRKCGGWEHGIARCCPEAVLDMSTTDHILPLRKVPCASKNTVCSCVAPSIRSEVSGCKYECLVHQLSSTLKAHHFQQSMLLAFCAGTMSSGYTFDGLCRYGSITWSFPYLRRVGSQVSHRVDIDLFKGDWHAGHKLDIGQRDMSS